LLEHSQAFSTSMKFTGESMKDLFCVQPNLKSLYLKTSSVISQKLVAATNFGKKSSNADEHLWFANSITEDTLKNKLNYHFKVIEYERVERQRGMRLKVEYKMMMKKSNRRRLL
jgi:TolB-like protein